MEYTEILLNRTLRMFEFDDVPETIDADFLARELLVHGRVGITTTATDKTYKTPHAWRGFCGGEITEFYTGSRFIGASPVIGSCDFKIGDGGVVIYNTTEDKFAPFAAWKIDRKKSRIVTVTPPDALPTTSLYQYITRTSEILENIDISTRTLLQTCRALIIITAKDEQTKAAAEQVLAKIYRGEIACVMLSNILDSINIEFAPTAANAAGLLSEYKEQYQFALAQFYNAIGIQANYNLKRERLNVAEIDVNEQSLVVNIVDMLKCRQTGIDAVNAMFGTNMSVQLGDEWKRPDRDGQDAPEQGDNETGGDGGTDERNNDIDETV